LLWYRQFRKDLEEIGFVFNPYEPCVANRLVNLKQHTVRFHVDDLKSSHVDAKVNDEFAKWLNSKYGEYGEVKVNRGKIHEYLGMTFDYSTNKVVSVSMTDYIESMVDDCTVRFEKKDRVPTPATEKLFTVDDNSKPLERDRAEELHTIVAKGLFACKRARPDIHPTIAFLCTRVKQPTEEDWQKLIRLLKYLNGTRQDKLSLRADNVNVLKWYVDAAFAVHPDFKSHTGATMTMGNGAIQSMSRKQKLNTRSSTEAELVGADDSSTLILWTRLFLEAQGIKIDENVLYQDNKSAILLEQNGKKSSSKRTRALNIRYFFVTDQIEKGNVSVEYCPTGSMIADYMTKPLQGKQFKKFKDDIMGISSVPPASSESGRSVLDLRNLQNNSQKIKKKSEKYPVKMG
jgi:hypothetical protein